MQKPIYSAEEEQLLMAKLWSPEIKLDPLAFVLFAYPWGQPNTPLAKFTGPRKWQREELRKLGEHIRENNGRVDPQAFRLAIRSGRGVG